MILSEDEVPVAYSMAAAAVQERGHGSDAIRSFMCYWAAFNNVYVTIAERSGRRAQLRRHADGTIRTRACGRVSVPEVSTVSERQQLDLAFRQFTEELNRGLVEHANSEFFVRRVPRWRGQRVERDAGGQRLNGVLNVGFTIDAEHPVWAPIDTTEFEAYQSGGNTPERRDALAKQVLDLLYTVRNNTFHGGKRADDANDLEVLTMAVPLLALIVESFVRVRRAA